MNKVKRGSYFGVPSFWRGICLVVIIGLVCSSSTQTEIKSSTRDFDIKLHLENDDDPDKIVNQLKNPASNPSEWLICGFNAWEDLKIFLPEAKMAGISVWTILIPPYQSPPANPDCPYSEPFGEDYILWAQEIAMLSLRYSNLIGYGIDNLQENIALGYLTQSYIDSMITTGKYINPLLKFIDADTVGILSEELEDVYEDATDWMNPVGHISVLTFVGVYNDSTHGNTNGDALSAACEWAADNNYVLHFPAGQYLLDAGQIMRVFPNSMLTGVYGETIFYTSEVSGTMCGIFHAQPAYWDAVELTERNVYIEGLTVIGVYPFDGTSGIPNGQYSQGILMSPTPFRKLHKIIVKNCDAYKIGAEAIRIIGAKVAWIEDCIVSNTRFTGFTVLNERSYLINNTTDSTYTGVEAYGRSYWGNSSLLYIDGNTIGIGSNYGISAGGVDTIKIINNTITGDTETWDDGFAGVQIRTNEVANSGASTLFEIDGNTIKKFYAGISTTNNAIMDTIEQITINNNSFDSLYLMGIVLRDTSAQEYIGRTDITNNTFTNWAMSGNNDVTAAAIYLYNYANSNQETYINDNTFYKDTDGWKSPLTLRITDQVNFVNNECTMPSTREIWINTTTNYLIQGNTGLPSPNAIWDWGTSTWYDQTP